MFINLSHEISEDISAGCDVRTWKIFSVMCYKNNTSALKITNCKSHQLHKTLVKSYFNIKLAHAVPESNQYYQVAL